MKTYKNKSPFLLENGESLSEIELAYTTHGKINQDGTNVIWICHALTANADPTEWWPGLVGPGKLYDTDLYFVVCANMLGSCYGSTCPQSINTVTGNKYGRTFPLITIRDIVRANILLRKELGINEIVLATGGSMGGQQVLEWAIMEPDMIKTLVVIGTNARHSPWGIAFNETQRMALEADPTFGANTDTAGLKGLEVARAIAMLSYRHYKAYYLTQMDSEPLLDNYRASSYQRYQGLKLRNRFDAMAYWTLSKAMDTHNVGRERGGVEKALAQIKARALVFGIETDYLFPISEQEEIKKLIQGAELEIIHSPFGHDGFLIEFDQITTRVQTFIQGASI